jgi:sialate O-acetylesterase
VAKIQKDGSIILSSKDVKSPVAIRYCFTNDGVPDLFDTNGLPLLPFRTDDWNTVFTDKKSKDHNYK